MRTPERQKLGIPVGMVLDKKKEHFLFQTQKAGGRDGEEGKWDRLAGADHIKPGS